MQTPEQMTIGQKCGNCKWLSEQEADAEAKNWGVEKIHACGKYHKFIKKMDSFVASRLIMAERLLVNPDHDGKTCGHWGKKVN